MKVKMSFGHKVILSLSKLNIESKTSFTKAVQFGRQFRMSHKKLKSRCHLVTNQSFFTFLALGKNGRKIKFLKKNHEKFLLRKCAPFSQILIFRVLVFCKHPYFDGTNWFNNENIVLYKVMWGQFWKFWNFEIFKGPKGWV